MYMYIQMCVCVYILYEKFQSYVKRQSPTWDWVRTAPCSIHFRPFYSVTGVPGPVLLSSW